MMEQPEDQYKPASKLELKEVKKTFPKVFKKVHCPSCDGEIDAGNLNLQNSVAKCGSCNVIFSIEEEVDKVKVKKEVKQEVLRPEGIDLFFYKDDLDITIQEHIQGLNAFGIFFLPVLSFFSILIYFTKGIPVYFPVVFTIGALYFIYVAFNYSKNKTYIDINDRFMNIKSRPKKLKKDKTYVANEIDQLYLKYAADGSGYYTIFMIINSIKGQKHEKLMTVNTLSKAKYLEQEIEKYLNIADRKVPESNVK